MNVRQLIAELSEFPLDMKVVDVDGDEIDFVERASIVHSAESASDNMDAFNDIEPVVKIW